MFVCQAGCNLHMQLSVHCILQLFLPACKTVNQQHISTKQEEQKHQVNYYCQTGRTKPADTTYLMFSENCVHPLSETPVLFQVDVNTPT